MKNSAKVDMIEILLNGHHCQQRLSEKFPGLVGKTFNDEDILDLNMFAILRRKNEYCCSCRAPEDKNG